MQINVAIFMLMLRFCCSEQKKKHQTKQTKNHHCIRRIRTVKYDIKTRPLFFFFAHKF